MVLFVDLITRTFGFKNSLFSNALKECVNEIDNNQEKDEKSWKGIGKYYLENFVLVSLLFCTSLLGMLTGVNTRAGFRHAIDAEEYELLK